MNLSELQNVVGDSLNEYRPTSGVYFLCFEYEIVYVGQSGDIPRRIANHKAERRKIFDMVFFIEVRRQTKRNDLEKFYIKACTPKYNWVSDEADKFGEPEPPMSLGVVPMQVSNL